MTLCPRLPFPRFLMIGCLVLAMLSACQAVSPVLPFSKPTPASGGIVYADGNRLWVIDPGSGADAVPARREVYNSGTTGTITDPAWSPDGSLIAYSFTPTLEPNATFGSDIYVIAPNGAGQRALFKHDVDGGLARSPTWTPDGAAVYFSYSFTTRRAGQTTIDLTQQVERLDLKTGERVVVAKDADVPALSADGSLLAYVGLTPAPPGGPSTANPAAGSPPAAGALGPTPDGRAPMLWLAEANGAGARPLVPPGLFTAVWAPRFAPDGQHLLFTAAGGDRSKPRLTVNRPTRTTGWHWPPSVAAHGYPMDLWLVEIKSGRLEMLAALAADDPSAAYAPDGQRLALMTIEGVFVLDTTTADLLPLTTSPGFGALDWAR